MSDVKDRQGAGRPTLYRPEMCEQVIAWGREGRSRTWMAAELGIDRSTIDAWGDKHDEFSLALTRAKALEQQFWENLAHSNITNREFQSSVWSRSMAARFPDEWRESTKQEQTVNGTMTVTVETGVPRE